MIDSMLMTAIGSIKIMLPLIVLAVGVIVGIIATFMGRGISCYCPRCGRQVSYNKKSCPGCGYGSRLSNVKKAKG